MWLSWTGESVGGRGGVEGVFVYPGRLDKCGLGWFDGGLGLFDGGLGWFGGGKGWFGVGLGWFRMFLGGLGCFNGPRSDPCSKI